MPVSALSNALHACNRAFQTAQARDGAEDGEEDHAAADREAGHLKSEFYVSALSRASHACNRALHLAQIKGQAMVAKEGEAAADEEPGHSKGEHLLLL